MGLAHVTAYAQQGKLLLSELLFQPRSGEAEYVELYNNSNADVELSEYHIVRWIGDSLGKHYSLPSYTVGAHEYVVLTKDAASVTANYTVRQISRLVECNLPTYPNDGGAVVLCKADSTIVQRLDYSPSMHSRLLRNKSGVSLERRDFMRDVNEASNWFSASSLSGYGTPGYENSQSSEYLVEEASFQFSSDIVSPDGDDYQDELSIEYTLDDWELAARAEVRDARGKLILRLLNGALLGTHGTILWNGRSVDGRRLPQGQYIIVITIYNTAGTQQVLKRTVALMYK